MSYRPSGGRFPAKMKLGVVMATIASASSAEQFSCTLEDGTPLGFSVDESLFVDAVSAEEPIRRKVTFVELGEKRFPAEPFRVGEMRGFSSESLGGGTLIFVVQADGTAVLSDRRAGRRQTATCERMQ